MSDVIEMAIRLMAKSADIVGKQRGQQHGPVPPSFEMAGQLWTVYLRHVRAVRKHDNIMAEDALQMMSLYKKVRSVYGDRSNDENFVDDIGYVALAGGTQLPGDGKPTDDQKIEGLGNDLGGQLDKDWRTDAPSNPAAHQPDVDPIKEDAQINARNAANRGHAEKMTGRAVK